MQKQFLCVFIPAFLLSVLVPPLAAIPSGGKTAPLGPLDGRNMYAPHLPWFSFPAAPAAPGRLNSIQINTALYYINEFRTYPFLTESVPLNENRQHELRAMDYESTICELGLSWQAMPEWNFSAKWRLHFRYGGFLDSVIQSWHAILHAPNAGREYFTKNQSDWNIRGSNIPAYSGQGFCAAPGDLDILTRWNFYAAPSLSLAASGAIKLPTGERSGGFSSGYPDLGIALLLDWYPWKRWAFYINTALILPLGPFGTPMFQFIPAAEFRLSRKVSILLQSHIQNSPVKGGLPFMHGILGETRMFALPQTNVKLGVKGHSGRFIWQCYFEEDPITWEGVDILIYVSAGYLFY